MIGTAGAKPLSPAQALAESRAQRERAGDPALSRWTPVLWGTAAAQAPIEAPAGKSAGRVAKLEPKPARPGWLQPVEGFVGRRLDLRSLDRDWLGPDERQAAGMDPEELEEKRARLCPIVLVTGIGGMGKTSLVAEITDTRHAEFDVVLAYRTAGDRAPVPTEWLTEIHQTLSANSHAYLEHCESTPEAPVYRPRRPEESFDRWLARRVESLCDFLRDNPVLVVMDNLETCLDPIAAANGHGYAGLQGWSVVLRMLAEGLSPKGRSRVVITSRRRPAELWDHPRVLHLPLGPLDPDEAMLFVRTSENLRALLLGPDDVERSDEQRERDLGLVAKALRASRGHPLLLGNLERIAAEAGALEKRINGLIGREPADLVKAFSVRGDATEAAYLTGVVRDSVRELVAALSPKALELLRVLTLAEPPVGVERIEAVWAGEPEGDPALAQIRKALAAMPEAMREQVIAQVVEEVPDEQREKMRAALRENPAKEPEPLAPLLAELTGHALVVMETSPGSQAGAAPRRALRWHELVREEAARALPSGERFEEPAWLRKHGMWAFGVMAGALQHPTQPDVETALAAGRAAYPFFLALEDWERVADDREPTGPAGAQPGRTAGGGGARAGGAGPRPAGRSTREGAQGPGGCAHEFRAARRGGALLFGGVHVRERTRRPCQCGNLCAPARDRVPTPQRLGRSGARPRRGGRAQDASRRGALEPAVVPSRAAPCGGAGGPGCGGTRPPSTHWWPRWRRSSRRAASPTGSRSRTHPARRRTCSWGFSTFAGAWHSHEKTRAQLFAS